MLLASWLAGGGPLTVMLMADNSSSRAGGRRGPASTYGPRLRWWQARADSDEHEGVGESNDCPARTVLTAHTLYVAQAIVLQTPLSAKATANMVLTNMVLTYAHQR